MGKEALVEQVAIEFIRMVTEPFITHPKDLAITVIALRSESTVIAKPHDDDYGQLVGKNSSMLRALCVLVREIGFRTGRRLKLTVLNPSSPARPKLTPFERRADWTGTELESLARRACEIVLPPPVAVRCEDLNDDMSVIRVHSSEPGPPNVINWIEEALGVVFFAIGKGMGRSSVLMELTVDPATGKDESRDGRFQTSRAG